MVVLWAILIAIYPVWLCTGLAALAGIGRKKKAKAPEAKDKKPWLRPIWFQGLRRDANKLAQTVENEPMK